ncbi:MAG: hypothetical protein ACRDY7_06465 [Acidimicrobiia bacterium]
MTLSDVRGLELSEERIRTLVRSAYLTRVAPRVFRVNGAPDRWQARVLAECLAAGPKALVSHRSAAALYGLNGFDVPALVDITVPRSRQPRRRTSVRLHASTDYHLADPATRQRIPLTGVARTILDLCASERNPAIRRRALDSARKLKLATWDELWACLDAHSRRGRDGIAAFRALLELRSGKSCPESGFEDEVRELLVSAGLGEPTLQHWVSTPEGRYRIDAAYVEPMIGIECKGRRDHFTEEAFENDPIRENALAAEGWHMFTVTWNRLRTDPEGFVRQIRRALRKRAR